ncbi:MAG: DUF1836 domain-containing protein [Cellulosilyticaceae bacterium]
MEVEWLQKYINELNLDDTINKVDIPSIDLYMDQVITLFETKLSHTKRYEDDKLLTKTMINNYTKDKVIIPVIRKKYTKEHIMMMSLLYQFKSIVSIGDIKKIFSLIEDNGNIDKDKLEKLFDSYQNCREEELEYFNKRIDEKVKIVNSQMEALGENDQALEKAILIASLIEQANYNKRLAEKIIDECMKKEEITQLT